MAWDPTIYNRLSDIEAAQREILHELANLRQTLHMVIERMAHLTEKKQHEE